MVGKHSKLYFMEKYLRRQKNSLPERASDVVSNVSKAFYTQWTSYFKEGINGMKWYEHNDHHALWSMRYISKCPTTRSISQGNCSSCPCQMMPWPWDIDVRTTFHVPRRSSQHAETSPQMRKSTVKASLRIRCAQAENVQNSTEWKPKTVKADPENDEVPLKNANK